LRGAGHFLPDEKVYKLLFYADDKRLPGSCATGSKQTAG
jgi:hypothetical protein